MHIAKQIKKVTQINFPKVGFLKENYSIFSVFLQYFPLKMNFLDKRIFEEKLFVISKSGSFHDRLARCYL